MVNDSCANRHATTSPHHRPPFHPSPQPSQGTDDVIEILQELRVLIPGVQVLTGFLLILPFNQDFRSITLAEKWVYMAAFVFGLISLILLSAPAAQHRLERPLRDPVRFKRYATQMTIVGLVPLSLALILTTQLIVAHTLGADTAFTITAGVAALLAIVWWIWPLKGRLTSRTHR